MEESRVFVAIFSHIRFPAAEYLQTKLSMSGYWSTAMYALPSLPHTTGVPAPVKLKAFVLVETQMRFPALLYLARDMFPPIAFPVRLDCVEPLPHEAVPLKPPATKMFPVPSNATPNPPPPAGVAQSRLPLLSNLDRKSTRLNS